MVDILHTHAKLTTARIQDLHDLFVVADLDRSLFVQPRSAP
jgi:hypothetical protein